MHLKTIKYNLLVIIDISLLVTIYLFNKYDIYSVFHFIELFYLAILFFIMKYIKDNDTIFINIFLALLPIMHIILFTKQVTILSISLVIYGVSKLDSKFFTISKGLYISICATLLFISFIFGFCMGSSWIIGEDQKLVNVYSPNNSYRLVITSVETMKDVRYNVYLEKRILKLFYKRIDNVNPIIYGPSSGLRDYYHILKMDKSREYRPDIKDVVKSLVKWKGNNTLIVFNKKVKLNKLHSYMRFNYPASDIQKKSLYTNKNDILD